MRITSKTADSISKSKQGPILELSEVWNRYCELVEQAGTGAPHSFASKRATFKEKLQPEPDVYDVVLMHNQAIGDKQTVLIHILTKFRHIPIIRLFDERDDESSNQVYIHGENEFFLARSCSTKA